MLSFDRLHRFRNSAASFRYTAAAVLVILSLAASAALEPVMVHAPSAPLFAAILLIAWLLGLGPAMFGAGLAVVPLAYLVDETRPRLGIDRHDVLWTLLFFMTLLAMAWLTSTVRRLEDERTALLRREMVEEKLLARDGGQYWRVESEGAAEPPSG